MVSEKLRVLHERVTGDPDPYAPATLSAPVDRLTLREVLAAGLDGRIAFGHELARYETGDGGVRLHFAGGASADADVLVGADGVQSAVRRQYLPDAEPADTGARCIYGKTPLRDLATLPSFVAQGFTAVVGGRIGMAVGPVRFREPPEAFGLSPAYDYLMWAVAGDRRAFGVPDEQLTTMDPAGLHALSAELIRTWHPGLRALHAQADIGETFGVRVRVSPPAPPWPPGRVTVLGDAIHAMSPAGGSGANTALRDAALLSRTLTAATGAGLIVPDAVLVTPGAGFVAPGAGHRGDRRLRAADVRVRLRRRRRLPPGRSRDRRPPQPSAVCALPPPGRTPPAGAVVPRSPLVRPFPNITEDPAVTEDPGSYCCQNAPHKPYPPR